MSVNINEINDMYKVFIFKSFNAYSDKIWPKGYAQFSFEMINILFNMPSNFDILTYNSRINTPFEMFKEKKLFILSIL